VIAADDGETLSYAQLDRRSRRLATALRTLGLGPGAHLAVLLDNTPRYFEVVWGGLLAGLHVTPISAYATADDIAYLVGDSGAEAVVAGERFAGALAGLPARTPGCRAWWMLGEPADDFSSYDEVLAGAADDPVPADAPIGEYMFYSSGTTGRPKGVLRPLSGRTVSEGTLADRFLAKVFGVDEESVFLSPAPLYHGAPLGFSMAVTSLGGTVVIQRRFDAAGAARAIERHRVTHSQWVPTMFGRMLALPPEVRHAHDLSSHRVAIHAAAPCPVHVKRAILDWWGPIVHEYYNGTEDVGMAYVGPEEWLAHPGTVGRPIGCAVHVCAEDGAELPVGEDGLIYFERRQGQVFRYHGDEAKTRGSRHPDHPGWATLGDIGHVDAEGYLYLTDRKSFMIISGGVNIYPREIEDVLIAHPAVADVAVIGVPNTDFGEEVKAIVEPAAGHVGGPDLAAELLAYGRANLAGPKRPRTVDFVDTLPRLPTGKLAKHELRGPYWPAAPGSGSR
jgi:fatty-acyl-CoA synthase